jgi:NADP-dependent 3-hydroxy acid dehydrogenase YdfG
MGNQHEVLSWAASVAEGAAAGTQGQERCAAGIAAARRVWMIADASSDAGVRLARAALACGDAVLAAARAPELLDALLGEDSASLVNVQMDTASVVQVMLAVRTALARFGRIDILVDAAGGDAADAPYYIAPAASGNALAVALPAVLPILLPAMREQGVGHIVSLGTAQNCATADLAAVPQEDCDPASRQLARDLKAAIPEYAARARITHYRSYCTVK